MHANSIPAPIHIDKLADILSIAQRHEYADHGCTRFHFGECSEGKPFLFAQNTVDGIGFELPVAHAVAG